MRALRRTWKQGARPCASTGRSIHAAPSITPSPREGIGDGPRLPQWASAKIGRKARPERHARRRSACRTLADGSTHRVRNKRLSDVPIAYLTAAQDHRVGNIIPLPGMTGPRRGGYGGPRAAKGKKSATAKARIGPENALGHVWVECVPQRGEKGRSWPPAPPPRPCLDCPDDGGQAIPFANSMKLSCRTAKLVPQIISARSAQAFRRHGSIRPDSRV